MTQEQKEKFLTVKTYEEYEKRQKEFYKLDPKDKEVREHYKKLLENASEIESFNKYAEEVYTLFPDGSKMIGGPGMKVVKEKGYKSVEDYERRIHEEWLSKNKN